MADYIDLAKKIQSLVEKGVGGEKKAAEKALEKLMKKYGFTLDDLSSETNDYHFFKVQSKDRQFFSQIAATILGKDVFLLEDRFNKKCLVIKTTKAFAIEIKHKFEFYLRAYNEDLKIFYRAFLIKNNLIVQSDEVASPEQIAKHYEAYKLSKGLEKKEYFKALN